MKKIIFLFAMLAAFFTVCGQTSTIEDHVQFIRLCYDSGDTLDIPKQDMIIYTDENGYRVYVKNRSYNVRALDPEDFGYGTARGMQDSLSNMVYNRPYFPRYQAFDYTSGLLDTASFFDRDSILLFQYNYNYDLGGDTVTYVETILPY